MRKRLERLTVGLLCVLALFTVVVSGCSRPVSEDSKDVSGEEAAAKAKAMLGSAKSEMGE
jgi:hypothetical protein